VWVSIKALSRDQSWSARPSLPVINHSCLLPCSALLYLVLGQECYSVFVLSLGTTALGQNRR